MTNRQMVVSFQNDDSGEKNLFAEQLTADLERHKNGHKFSMQFTIPEGTDCHGIYNYCTTSKDLFCRLGLMGSMTHLCFIFWLEKVVFLRRGPDAMIALCEYEQDDDGEWIPGKPRQLNILRLTAGDYVTYHLSPAN